MPKTDLPDEDNTDCLTTIPGLASHADEVRTSSSVFGFSFSTAETLRAERRKTMPRPISDEALIAFNHDTMAQLSKR